MEENNNGAYALKQIEIRLKVKESDPLYSAEPIDSADKAVKLIAELMKGCDRECVYVLNCDKTMKPISYNLAAIGGMHYAYLDPGNIYKSALLSNAVNIMVMHVHPSGSNAPSQADIAMTERVAISGAILGIPLQDHIIVAGGTGALHSMRYSMPDLFTDPVGIAEKRGTTITDIIAVAEPAAAMPQTAHPIPQPVYNEVMLLMQRQQDLMQDYPEAWRLAGDVAEIAYSSNGMQINTQDYETTMFMVDAADRIKERETDGIRSTINEIAETSKDIALVRKSFQTIIALSRYDGEWQPASKEIEDIFDKRTQTSYESKNVTPPRAEPTSLKTMLESKVKEAETINSSRALPQAGTKLQQREAK